MVLPQSYEKRMREQLGESEFQAYEACLTKRARSALRVNTRKITTEAWNALSPFTMRRVPWISNGYYYDDTDAPSKHPYYYAGLYYLQEPSAMTPANLLPIEPGDRVLDVCAAPGGKSTELAAKLQGTGLLVANDISASRAKALLKNLEVFGATNVLVISEETNKLTGRFAGFFDKILVDAPCSGEGMFRKQPAIIKNWEQYGTEYYTSLQKSILPNAVAMLKPGGMLLYSTCTFSALEDEETVAWLLRECPEMELLPVIPEGREDDYAGYGFMTGRPDWMTEPL
ncbi:MAG: RsmB/NOP family class I SAM-dependent RNA methyltransferase, partial [Lachnospiraceae bacterium]|nr:RsmB/NOP family class I SAM-dependent RNA methyltransferase [Lachnospiraceae bacterium]